MRFIKYIIYTLLPLIIFVFTYRVASGLTPYISLYKLSLVFERFPDSTIFVENFNRFVNALSKVLVVDRYFDIPNNAILGNETLTRLGIYLTDFVFDLAEIIDSIFYIFASFCRMIHDFFEWVSLFLRYITTDRL